MRTYSKIDLLRYYNFAKQHLDLSPTDRVHLYDETYKEISEEDKIRNLKKFFEDYSEIFERRNEKC